MIQRLTRPFRVMARALKNLLRAGAWNPKRWPLLAAGAVRTVRTRGLKGALVRSQQTQAGGSDRARGESVAVETVGDPRPPGRLAPDGEPLVSVIIPVHNRWLYTAACLRSLDRARGKVAFEVIVVDDQSTDETSSRLAAVEGLVRVGNERSLGFAGSCNRGAARARGRFLVLLNNHVQVADGWLDALLETFEIRNDAGIVGARLLNPDGSLREAGGIVFSDGSIRSYGKDDRADRPEYRFLREADCCSSACIMLEAALFSTLGGLDDRLAPACREDMDLAFRARAKGVNVYVQPAATAVCHQDTAFGADPGTGANHRQAMNREKFLERWGAELRACPAPIVAANDTGEMRRARDHRLRGRVLVIDAYTPEPDRDSASFRLCHLMQCLLDLGYGVTFLPDNRAHAGRHTVDLQKAGIEAVYDPWIDSPPRFFSRRGGDFDYVFVSRHYVAGNYLSLVRRHCPQARFIFDTVDLHYLREERMAELENSLPLRVAAAQTRRSELAVIQGADATVVVSPVEKSVLEEAAPDARVHVISNVHEVVGSRRPFAERSDLFFVGGFQHPPNVDAAVWFVSRIWPLIRRELPDLLFHLVGSNAPAKVRELEGDGVRFHGHARSLDPWLDGCRLAVAPLRFGAGIKGKVNMSMARGQPVVATPIAVEGMFAHSGREVLIAESVGEFAEAVIRLYRDEELWNRISLAGLENVRRYFSVETARLGLSQLLDSL